MVAKKQLTKFLSKLLPHHPTLWDDLFSNLSASTAKITKPLSDETAFSLQTVLSNSTGQYTPHPLVRYSSLMLDGI